MVSLDLSADEKAMLREVLESDASELGYEISNTDSKDFRDQLKRKRELIQRVIAQLGDA